MVEEAHKMRATDDQKRHGYHAGIHFGFRRGHSCDDIAGILRQSIFISSGWGLPLLVGAADIEIAFDTMKHSAMSDAMLRGSSSSCGSS